MRTLEARVLDHHPEIRVRPAEPHEFAARLQVLKPLEVDGETLYLRGGDLLRDRDQVMFEWARKQGWITDEAIARALAVAPS